MDTIRDKGALGAGGMRRNRFGSTVGKVCHPRIASHRVWYSRHADFIRSSHKQVIEAEKPAGGRFVRDSPLSGAGITAPLYGSSLLRYFDFNSNAMCRASRL